MKVIVSITDGKRTYSEDVTDEQLEYYEEISTSGTNPEMELIKFEDWVRPIKEKLTDTSLDKYNTRDENCHFIFGWMEGFSQSEYVPEWIYNAKDLWIEVKKE